MAFPRILIAHLAVLLFLPALQAADRHLDLVPVETRVRRAPYNHVTTAVNMILATSGSATNLVVIEPSPGGASIIGGCRMPITPYHATSAGDYVYVSGSPGVAVVDISVPSAPQFITRVGSRFITRSIVVSNLLYSAHGTGLQVADITNPREPQLIPQAPSHWAMDVAVQGQHAYATGTGNQIQVYDLTDPQVPRFLHFVPVSASGNATTDIEIVGSLAYVVIREKGLAILDLSSTPENPVVLSLTDARINSPPVVQDGLVFFGRDRGGITVLDVRDPRAVKFAGQLPGDDTLPDFTTGVAVLGDTAYFTFKDFLLASRILPATPPRTGVVDFTGTTNASISLGATNLLVSASNLFEVSVEEPNNPFVLRTNVSIGLSGFAHNADRAVGLVGSMVTTFERAPDGQFAAAGQVEISIGAPQARPIELVGRDAFLANGQYGLQVFDLENPAAPRLAASLTNLQNVQAVQIDGSLGVLLNDGRPVLFDVSNPADPAPKEPNTGVVNASAVALKSHRLYVAGRLSSSPSGPFRVFVFDVSHPDRPVLLGNIPLRGRAERIAVFDSLLFVGEGRLGFQIFHLPEPEAPAGAAKGLRYPAGLNAGAESKALRVGGNSATPTFDFAFRAPYFYTLGDTLGIFRLPETQPFRLNLQLARPGQGMIQIQAPSGTFEVFASSDLTNWNSLRVIENPLGVSEFFTPLEGEKTFFRAMRR